MKPIVLVILSVFSLVFGQIPTCPPLAAHTPKDIHDVKPNNIKVIMALGDSITAGFAAMGRDTLYLFDEWRGVSGTIGGDPGAITLATILQQFSPGLVGPATGNHFVELPEWNYYANDNGDGAQSNAHANDLYWQIQYLAQWLQSNPNIDFVHDYKLMTVLIGANDACQLCGPGGYHVTPQQAAADYKNSITSAVQQIYDTIPRVILNVLPMFNVSQVYNVSLGATYCADFHDVLPVECFCAFDSDYDKRTFLDTTLQLYGEKWRELALEWKAKNLDDFAIVLQPFTSHVLIPSLDFLSTIDCFHPSLLAHQQLAIAIWNSVITPGAQKPTTFTLGLPINCPSNSTLIYTDYP